MNTPPTAADSRMFCRSCGYALIGLSSNCCPECGREFNPANPKSFLAHPPRTIFRRIVKLILVLFCLTIPADVYFGYLDWRVHREKIAIQFLRDHGAVVSTYDSTPHRVKVVLHGRGAWLWERADRVYMDGFDNKVNNIPQFMSAVGNLKSLRMLDLLNVPVMDSNLANLKSTRTLQRLNLYGIRMTDAGLTNLKALVALQDLDLIDMPVTDAGLANLQGLTALQELAVCSASVTDAGLVNLKGLNDLVTLDLDGTSVTDDGLANLKGLRNLQRLDLSNTQVTDEGVAALQKSLSRCEILH